MRIVTIRIYRILMLFRNGNLGLETVLSHFICYVNYLVWSDPSRPAAFRNSAAACCSLFNSSGIFHLLCVFDGVYGHLYPEIHDHQFIHSGTGFRIFNKF